MSKRALDVSPQQKKAPLCVVWSFASSQTVDSTQSPGLQVPRGFLEFVEPSPCRLRFLLWLNYILIQKIQPGKHVLPEVLTSRFNVKADGGSPILSLSETQCDSK